MVAIRLCELLPGIVDMDPRHHGHSGPQALDQRLPRFEIDSNGDALHDLGEIGGIVWRQQGKGRAAGWRKSRHRPCRTVSGNISTSTGWPGATCVSCVSL